MSTMMIMVLEMMVMMVRIGRVERLYQGGRTQPGGGIHYVAVGDSQAAVGLHAAHADGCPYFLCPHGLEPGHTRTENFQAKEKLHIKFLFMEIIIFFF